MFTIVITKTFNITKTTLTVLIVNPGEADRCVEHRDGVPGHLGAGERPTDPHTQGVRTLCPQVSLVPPLWVK